MKKELLLIISLLTSLVAFGQFEEPQLTGAEFEKLKVNLGADFTMQYQGLNHHADSALIPLGKGFNLPTANMNIKALLAPGITVNVITYLSARHHNEAWVKGGYLLIDEMPFFNSDGIDKIMNYLTIKVGDMEIDYGDAHYRRTDNGKATTNPFVGNYIVEAFTTQIAMELMFRSNGLILMGAVSNGSLKPALSGYSSGSETYTDYNTLKELAFYWKAGYDKQFNDNFRFRITLSGYHQPTHHFGSLYYGERAGSRYYLVMNKITNSSNDVDITKNHTSGRWSPGLTNKDNSFMGNLFVKASEFEAFGTVESFKGTLLSGASSDFKQYAFEGLYRFGNKEQLYGGARYNYVKNNLDQTISRFQLIAGWYIIDPVLVKLEYVKQAYKKFSDTYGANAGFDGIMFEGAVSF